MRIGASYMSHHNPKHIESDIREMRELGFTDVMVAMQENDFVHFTGKLNFTPKIAADHGLMPIAIFWGALNLFGGGKSSQFRLENPDCFQVARDGSHRPNGCYVNPKCVGRIEQMIDRAVEAGYAGYFVDEPTPLRQCFCPSCRAKFDELEGGDLASADEAKAEEFRRRCVVDYVRKISDYCAENHPKLETSCCIMPVDKDVWEETAKVDNLANLGTDIYWVNNDRDLEEMRALVREFDELCRAHNKIHHEWLQCWKAQKGREGRILDQGRVLLEENPDAMYIWAWKGQIGTTESCDDPEAAWDAVVRLMGEVKG